MSILNKPKILIFDIESLPMVSYAFTLWGYKKPDMILRERAVVTIAYKWYGDKKCHVIKNSHKTPYNDANTIKEFSKVLAEADYVVGHFSDGFDLPYLRGRCFINGIEPIPQVTSIDTYKLVKKHFNIPAKRLDYLGKVLGLGGKISTSFDLWKRCAEGDKQAIDEMAAYNKQDVVLLEAVFERLLPHVGSKLNYMLFNTTDAVLCPHCGSHKVQKRGLLFNLVNKKQRYQCRSCSTWFSTRYKDD